MMTVGTLLFPGFELLDVFGPLEMFGGLPDDYRLVTMAERAGAVASNQGPKAIADIALMDAAPLDILLIPGGRGTRREVDNVSLINCLRSVAEAARVVATVCTGTALLAHTGLLDGRKATTNKAAFRWVEQQGPAVLWQRRARWVSDGKFWTSSGVSAGIDMALGLIAAQEGRDKALKVANYAEYRWIEDAQDDPFADLYT
jgi:putative intracellular protease/amidase